MNEFAKKYGAPPLPSVNLLPKDIAEKRKTRAVQATALFAILIAIGAVVAAYLLALGAKTLAESDREDARNAQTAAVSERDAKQGVYYAYRDREVQEYSLTQIGVGEVDYRQLAAAFLDTADDETSFDKVTLLGPSALGTPATSVDPVSGGGVGLITFEARATTVEGADALITRIEAVPGVANVTVQNLAYTADSEFDYVAISGTAAIAFDRLTLRLVPQEGVTLLDVFATLAGEETPVTDGTGETTDPATSPSPSPSAEGTN